MQCEGQGSSRKTHLRDGRSGFLPPAGCRRGHPGSRHGFQPMQERNVSATWQHRAKKVVDRGGPGEMAIMRLLVFAAAAQPHTLPRPRPLSVCPDVSQPAWVGGSRGRAYLLELELDPPPRVGVGVQAGDQQAANGNGIHGGSGSDNGRRGKRRGLRERRQRRRMDGGGRTSTSTTGGRREGRGVEETRQCGQNFGKRGSLSSGC